MKLFHVAAATAVAAAVSFVPTAASAAPSGDPNRARPATPAHACASIPATLAQFDIPYSGSYSDCVRTVAGRVPDLPELGSVYEQCALLERGFDTPGGTFQITYPYTFHAEPGDPLPDLVANDRTQCARALWTFHAIEAQAGPPAG